MSATEQRRDHECSACGHAWTAPVEFRHDTPNLSGEATPWCPKCHARASQSGPAYRSAVPLSDFIRDQSITMTCKRIDMRPDLADFRTEREDAWQRDASHWRCTLRRSGDQRRSLTAYYSMGSACVGEPTADGVLASLLLDASGPEEFADWCGDFGYDTDSRSAERTFKACQAIARKLRRFLGDQYGAELGYISIVELLANGAELDFHFKPRPMSAIKSKVTP